MTEDAILLLLFFYEERNSIFTRKNSLCEQFGLKLSKSSLLIENQIACKTALFFCKDLISPYL